jgi:O-glycosyl hydrolase
LLTTLSASASPQVVAAPAQAGSATVTVHEPQKEQVVDGFGFTEAFREPSIAALPGAELQQLGSLLFDPSAGAGLSIVRFGLGEPSDLGGPGDVADQVWLGKLAEQFGVNQFYADSWSAPAQMKTNNDVNNGGTLCGVPGAASCLNGADDRQAYANLLASQATDFADQGILLKAIDFVNEPNLAATYPSMVMDPAQIANFVPFLGSALKAQHLRTTVACCDAEGWDLAPAYTSAVLGDPAVAKYIGLITSHGYTAPPTVPLTSQRHVWETEWADFSPFDPAWDDGTAGSGFTWAQRIQTALTSANVNAFFYEWGASQTHTNSTLIYVNPTDLTLTLSTRYWAFAAFSRYIRPGAVRVGATTSDSNLQVSAFRNQNDSQVVEILNTGTTDEPVTLQGLDIGGVSAYVTNATDALTPVSGPLTAPARSLLTVVITQ